MKDALLELLFMHPRNLLAATSSLLVLIILCLAAVNLQPVSLNLVVSSFSCPLAAVIVLAVVAGLLSGVSASRLLPSQARQERQLAEWQAADAKLAASVQSDREKQLEAKIATLETALKQALGKRG